MKNTPGLDLRNGTFHHSPDPVHHTIIVLDSLQRFYPRLALGWCQ